MRRLDCADSKNWTAFRHLLVSKMEAGYVLGQDFELQEAAEGLLAYADATGGEVQEELGKEFFATLLGQRKRSRVCFPGYQAACLVRVLRYAAEEAERGDAFETSRQREVYESLQLNALFCADLFGKDASLEFVSSTSWPNRLLDLEVHLRSSVHPAVTKRLSARLPPGVETYEQLRQLWPPPDSLRPGSVDPQGISDACDFCHRHALRRPLQILSVDGGHCALWLEPAVTIKALFEELVTTRLASYREGEYCASLMGHSSFELLEMSSNQQYFSNNPLFRSVDVLVAQWVGEAGKLRVHYSKPVIAYLGFLLLNDPVVGKYHPWSEPLDHYWERFTFLQDCDVHSLQGKPPKDGGPPCAVVYEEPQLAEAAYWQTGFHNPSVRPLSLYVGATHRAALASEEVLVINRGRLVRDVHFTMALMAMRHPSYPYTFVDQKKHMPYADMALYRAAVMMPWDLNLVMFHDLYAMNLPLFLPDLPGLHRVATTYFSRFKMNSAHDEQPFGEQMISGRNSPHQYSPFQLEYLEARDYWLQFTEYLRAPAVGRFSGLPDLLLQVANLNGPAVSAAMQDQNQLSFQQSQAFWSRILGVFQDLGLPASEAKDAAPVWHFKTPWADSLCWSGVLSEARCCDPAFGTVGAPGCFDDFWTFHRCCVQNVSFPPLDDAACGSGGPYGTTLVSPLDGPPWVQEVPSQEEPFVFIWDEKSGGTAFMQWLKYSVWKLGKLESSFMYTMPGHPVAVGSPFYLKTAGPEARARFEVVSGHFDWRVMHEGVDCPSRKKVRCFLLVRDPIDRFLSYYRERTDGRYARGLGRGPSGWSAPAWRRYLRSVERDRLWYDGKETGVFCNRENMLCVDLEKTGDSHPLAHRVRPKAAKEMFYFRFLGGPQNRLAWALDPEHGKARTAIWRLRRCVVGLQMEDPKGFREVLGHHFPWLHELKEPRRARSATDAARSRGGTLRRTLPSFALQQIAAFNRQDMLIYAAARRQFRRQLNRIRRARTGPPRLPPVAEETVAEAQAILDKALSHTATWQNHHRLSAYLMR